MYVYNKFINQINLYQDAVFAGELDSLKRENATLRSRGGEAAIASQWRERLSSFLILYLLANICCVVLRQVRTFLHYNVFFGPYVLRFVRT